MMIVTMTRMMMMTTRLMIVMVKIFPKVKTHIEEAKRLLATNFRKPHGEHLVRYLGASYDDFRKEIWVVSVPSIILGALLEVQ